MSDRFPTTDWSAVFHAGAGTNGDTGRVDAANRLLEKYWRPVYAFLRARGYSHEESEDLTQGFFLKVLERRWLARAVPQKGRFRTFMLTLLIRYVSDCSLGRVRRQERFERRMTRLEAMVVDVAAPGTSPEAAFDHEWTLALLERARKCVAGECEARGRRVWQGILDTLVCDGAAGPKSQEDLASRLNATRDQIRYGLTQVRRMFDEALGEELRLDGCPEDYIAQEIAAVKRTFFSA